MKEEELYLEEDKDLLSKLDIIDQLFVGLPELKHSKMLAEIQIKSILRSRKTNHDMSESTTRFSIILISIGVVQIIYMGVQYALPFINDQVPYANVFRYFTLFALVGMIVYSVRKFGSLLGYSKGKE